MKVITLLVMLILPFSIFSEEQDLVEHTITFKSQFNQYKDELNYGLVYSGVNLGVGYTYLQSNENALFEYSPELGFGASFNKGIGVAWRLRPIDINYGWTVTDIDNKPFYLGMYVQTNYGVQLYPELRSGHSAWMTSFEIGPMVSFILNILERDININFTTSVAGVTSRPELQPESHFYSLSLNDFIKDAHSNLEFGMSNKFYHTQLGLTLLRETDERFSFGYELEIFSYYQTPSFHFVNHSLNFNLIIGEL
ncbi:MAG: hypothetical protein ACE364_08345 [Chlorobiota bacterium]